MNNELLKEQTSINTQDSKQSSELIEKKEIKNTPFHMVKENGKKGFLALGMYKLTEDIFEEDKEAEKYIKKNQWEITLKISFIVSEMFNKKMNENE